MRLAKEYDIKAIMEIVDEIIEMMKKENNPQWDKNYPTEEIFLNDISKEHLYVYEKEKEILGFLCIQKNQRGTYQIVKENADLSYDLHRLGVKTSARNNNVASNLILFAEKLAKENNMKLIKADTEISNVRMNNLFRKLGFQFIQEFHWPDQDGTFNYYEKRL